MPVPELVPELVPLLVPAPLEPDVFEPLVPLEVPEVFEPLVPLLDDPALLAPELELEPVLVRVPVVSLVLAPLLLLLLGRVVGSLLVELPLVSRVRDGVVLVLVSLLSQPMKAMPPNASAAETRIACVFINDLVSENGFPVSAATPRPPRQICLKSTPPCF